MTTTTAPPPPRARSQFTTWWFITACVFVVVLAIAGVITAVGHARTDPTVIPALAGPAGPACRGGAGEQSAISGTPAHTWVLVGAIGVPASEQAGPSRTDQGVRSCWAQSPTGAVFAAAYMLALGSSGQANVLLEELTTDSPGREAAAAATGPGQVPASTDVQLAGFRLLDYTPEQARVQIAVLVDGSFTQAMTVDLVWEGDWRLYVPSTGQIERTALSSTAGFTPFAEAPGVP